MPVPRNARRLGKPTPADIAQPTAGSRRGRLLVGLAWGLIQVVIVCVLFFAGLLAAGYLSTDALSGRGANTLAPVGFCVGAGAGLWVNHRARNWLQRLRLRGLRTRGVVADAEVVKLGSEYTPNPTGAGFGTTRCTVLVSWRDPVTGSGWRGECRYRFWGRSRRLELACPPGARVPVYYPAGRPSRFIIDIPFAPTMADVLL